MKCLTFWILAITSSVTTSISGQSPQDYVGARTRVRVPSLSIDETNATLTGWTADSVRLLLRDVPVAALMDRLPGHSWTSLSSWTAVRVWSRELGLSGQRVEAKRGEDGSLLIEGDRFSVHVSLATITRLMFVGREGEPVTVPAVSFETIDVYQGHGSHALAGAGVGLVAGFVTGWAIGGVCFNLGLGPPCGPPTTGDRAKTGAALGVVGMMLGAFVGSKVRRDRWLSLRDDRIGLNVVARDGFGVGATLRF